MRHTTGILVIWTAACCLWACDDAPSRDSYAFVPGYGTIADFVTQPDFAAFVTGDGTGFTYCTGVAGDFGLDGVYEPHLRVTACRNCGDVGLLTDETERVRFCPAPGEEPNVFETGLGTVSGFTWRTKTLAARCAADPDLVTFYTAMVERSGGCISTWITVETHRFWGGFDEFTDGDRVDLVVAREGDCPLAAPRPGDWFRLGPIEDYWAPVTLVRRGNCPGDAGFRPAMCAFVQPCLFGDECGPGTFCNVGAEYIPTCVPDACQACFNAEQLCGWFHDCTFDACSPIE